MQKVQSSIDLMLNFGMIPTIYKATRVIRRNLEVATFPTQHGFDKFLCYHYITIIF